MDDAEGPVKEPDAEPPGQPLPADRDVYWDDGLPGQPLTALLFWCPQHAEEKVVDYYDPDDPPRCSRGDLMVRKAR
jgi:hypothetical protein